MKKSIEMKRKLEELKNTIKGLQDQGKIDEAHAKLSELTELKNAIAVQEVLEEDEVQNFNGNQIQVREDKMNVNRIFNKMLLGKSVTEEEREFLNAAGTPGQVEATDGKGGYLVPVEQFNEIKELRRELVSLKGLCNVVPVTSLTGTLPIEKGNTGELISFEELNEINKSDVDFGQVKYTTADYGDIIPISNTLLSDENVNLSAYIGRRFVKKAVNTENKKIIALLKGLTPKPAANIKVVNTALNVDLDPAISQNAIIITNQTGFNFLDNLDDKQGRPLLEINLQNTTQKTYKGRPVIVLSDALLPMNTTKAPVFVGDLTEFVSFFDREGLELAVSSEAGFTKNATYMRAIERFDVKKVDEAAMVYLELATS
jgi:hypothetical protein